MNRKLKRILFISPFLLYTLNFILVSCNTTEPPITNEPPAAVKDTITIKVRQTTHRSITLKITSTFNKPAKSIELYRRRENKDTLVERYTAFTLEKEIIDDDSGKGLIIDTEYKYFSVRVDTANKWIDTSGIITARTLPPTSHDYIWEEFTIGDEGYSNALYDVWGTDENNVYAVGLLRIDDVYYGVLHWDGNNWIPIADAGGRAIFGFSENDIWVAGGGVFHYDGNKWSQIDSKLVNSRAVILDSVLFNNTEYTSIWGTSSENLYLGNMWGKIVRWDGRRGQITEVQTAEGIRDIWGFNENDIYAAAGTQIGYRSDLYHFDGQKWEIILKGVQTPSEQNEFQEPFLTIWGYQSNLIYLGGQRLYVGNKGKWEDYGNIGMTMNKIRGTNDNDIFAVGAWGYMAHYNGVDWHIYNEYVNPENSINSICISSDRIFAVGRNNNYGVIFVGIKN